MCDHTAMISMLRSYDGGKKLISAGMDKKVRHGFFDFELPN